MSIKDYMGCENARNKKYARLYMRLIQTAYGTNQDVFIGHHLTFEAHGDIESVNEIPSADTLMFDHDIMGKVFGANAYTIMAVLARYPADDGSREAILQRALDNR